MEQMAVRMNEWALTQGMVGYKRVLEQNDVSVETNTHGIIVTTEALEQLPKAYFTYFLKKHSFAKRSEGVLRGWHAKWKKGDQSLKKDLNTRLKDIENRVGKYFKEHKAGSL